MDTPLISFIIVSHDTPATALQKCVESILALQLTDEEREIIVVDDGSSVAFLATTEKFADSVLLVRQPQCGKAAARNLGMRISKGKYMQILDGSSYIFPGAYAHCLDMARYYSPEIIAYRATDKPEGDTEYGDGTTIDGIRFMRETGTFLPTPCSMIFSAKTAKGLIFRTDANESSSDEEFATMLIVRADSITETDTVACHIDARGTHKGVNRKDKRLVAERLDDDLALILRLDDIALRMPPATQKVIKRRVSLLTADYLTDVIKLTRSRRQIRQHVETLRQHNLFPIAYAGRSARYFLLNKLCAIV